MNIRHFLIRSLALVALALVLAGCNTVKGVGKDVERAGEVIQGRSAQLAPGHTSQTLAAETVQVSR